MDALPRQRRPWSWNLPGIIPATWAFARGIATGKDLPEVKWTFAADGGRQLRVTTGEKAVAARLWTAAASSPDLRGAKWTSWPIARGFNLRGQGRVWLHVCRDGQPTPERLPGSLCRGGV